jgi:hypothetical protein
MTLREVFNLTAFLLLLITGMSSFFVLRDVAQHQQPSYYEMAFVVLSAAPWVLTLVTGQAYGIAFATSFYYGGSGVAKRGHSMERAWARQGKGQEAAHALLWRDRMVGDTPGMMVVLELAQLDPDLKPEALRAAHRLFGRAMSRAERDHVGRLYQQAGIGQVKATYPGNR